MSCRWGPPATDKSELWIFSLSNSLPGDAEANSTHLRFLDRASPLTPVSPSVLVFISKHLCEVTTWKTANTCCWSNITGNGRLSFKLARVVCWRSLLLPLLLFQTVRLVVKWASFVLQVKVDCWLLIWLCDSPLLAALWKGFVSLVSHLWPVYCSVCCSVPAISWMHLFSFVCIWVWLISGWLQLNARFKWWVPDNI